MNAKFFKTNKNIFLKYFEDSATLSASISYDQMINDGQFETMAQIIRSKAATAQEYINKTMEALGDR